VAVGPFVVAVSNLRKRLASHIDEVNRGKHPLFITHHGVVAAVLISRDEYRDLCPDVGRPRRPGDTLQPVQLVPKKPPSRRSGRCTVLPTRRVWTQYGWCDFEAAQVLAEQGVDTKLILTEEGWMTDDEG
jgi:prevent-host-death family protein